MKNGNLSLFPNRSRKQSHCCPSHQNKWHWQDASGAGWRWPCHAGESSERAQMYSGIALAPTKWVTGKVSRQLRFGKVWALVFDYKEMFLIDGFYPRTCSTTANTNVGFSYKRSLKETPGRVWGVLVKSQSSTLKEWLGTVRQKVGCAKTARLCSKAEDLELLISIWASALGP